MWECREGCTENRVGPEELETNLTLPDRLQSDRSGSPRSSDVGDNTPERASPGPS